MVQINQIQKRELVMQTNKFLILVNLFKKQITMLKLLEIEGKIPSISGLANKATLTAVENKILGVSNLVKKTDYYKKIDEIEKKKKITGHDHDKYIGTPEFNKLTAEEFAASLKQANLVKQTEFNNTLMDLNKKITQTKKDMYLLKMN